MLPSKGKTNKTPLSGDWSTLRKRVSKGTGAKIVRGCVIECKISKQAKSSTLFLEDLKVKENQQRV